MIIRALPALLAMVLLAGCRTLVVSSDNAELKGVPFLTKVPESTVTTTYQQVEWLSISAKLTVGTGTTARTESLLPMPVKLRPTADNKKKIQELQNAIDGLRGTEGMNASAAALAFVKKANELSNLDQTPLDSSDAILQSNVRGVEMVVSPIRYYLQPQMPLLGSSTHTFKLAGDGTLTETTSTAEDKTGETLLGMLPVNSFLTKRWVGTGSSGSNEAKVLASTAERGWALKSLLERTPNETPATFTLTVEESLVTFTARARCPHGSVCSLPVKVPLDSARSASQQRSCSGKDDINCGYIVELVSTARSGQEAPKKDDDPAYTISGKITPPKP